MKFVRPPQLLAILCLLALTAGGAETPMSFGAAARVDTPILRVPMMAAAPTIDGVMADGEWDDAAALSAFWYDFGLSDFRFLAPQQTNLRTFVAYDKEHLYFAVPSPVFPKNSWLKARGRFPDVLSHPLYGMLWDDHVELELRPFHDLARGFQYGLFRWDVNPINAYCDWYWSQQGGHAFRWQSNAIIRSQVDNESWVIEYSIPLASLIHGGYDANDADGQPLVQLPPPDGTIYRCWIVRGIGGNGTFFNVFDNHSWNTTKTQLILDANAPSFQITELGPIMEDIIDVSMVVKNHSTRSQTVRLGFFVESSEGTIYSSYEAPELSDGLLELRPGERREVRLRQPFPGISVDGNVLWFDVRAAGKPAKVLFRTRLIRFHSMDGGVVVDHVEEVPPGAAEPVVVERDVSFRERRLDAIEELRPPRKAFEFSYKYSAYNRRLWAFIDRGIHGSSDESKTAVEAKLMVMKDNEDEDEILAERAPFQGNFACFLVDLPGLVDGESYKLGTLLFDANQRIVGEAQGKPFTHEDHPWVRNQIGLDDTVWEPFTAIAADDQGFDTLRHRFTVGKSGLPSQLFIKPDSRELPLERRRTGVPDDQLVAIGRGPQLRSPMRLEAVIGGQRVAAEFSSPAKRSRTGKSEVEYVAALQLGSLPVELTVRYDCDGSMHAALAYGSEAAVDIEGLELVMDLAGPVDLAYSETGNGGMTGADIWECSLPTQPGVVWDCSRVESELFYNRFVPWFFVGSGDRAWSWYSVSDAGWILDREGDSMRLERNQTGEVTWRVFFVNHAATIRTRQALTFSLLTHPAKPKPAGFRRASWHYFGGYGWAEGYAREPLELSEEYLLKRWRRAASAPADLPDDQRTIWRKDEPPFMRYGQWRNIGVCPELDQVWEDKATYFFEQHIRIGRRVGWWMDEYFPVAFGRSDNLAMGNARLRDPAEVQGDELPWHSGFLTDHMRNHYKRLARVFAEHKVPQRQHTWSNNACLMLEPFLWNSLLVEECGAGHRSYEIDVVTQFPASLYRCMSRNYTGLITTVCADTTPALAGDDKRLDRQHFGRALLNDIGVAPSGPHGIIHHGEQAVRLLSRLNEFGFFDDALIEKIPYWRVGDYVTVGEGAGQVYVTVYRRQARDGNGVEALLVVMNETLADIELPLQLRDRQRLLGGSVARTQRSILAARPELTPYLATYDDSLPAMMDLETGHVLLADSAAGTSFGPLHVPYHDYRVLYARSGTAP